MRSVLLALLLAASCSAGGSAPLLLSVLPVQLNPDAVALLWEPAGGYVGRYAVEWRAPGTAFAEIASRASQAGGYPDSVDLTGVAPDAADLEFRVRADPGERVSNSIVYHRGTRSASVAAGYGPDASTHAITVTYTNRSLSAARIILERRAVQPDGAAGPWTQVDAGHAGTNTFLDYDLSQWIDGAHYEYRATAAGGDPSEARLTSPSPLLTPVLVSFTPGASGATLVIRNLSKYAASLTVSRSSDNNTSREVGNFQAPAASATAEFTDQLTPGLWRYELRATSDRLPTSAAASAWKVMPDPGSLLSPSIIGLQQGDSAVRDASGRFGVMEAIRPNYFPLGAAVFPPGGDGASALVVADSNEMSLDFLVDAAGHVHTAWYALPASRTTVAPIIHAWHDGAGWQREEIAQRPYVTASAGQDQIAFDIGLDGTLFAAWAGPAGFEVASQGAGGAWAVQQVPATLAYPLYDGQVAISGDENGVPHLIYLAFASKHYFPGANGWQSEPVPISIQVQYGRCGAHAFAGRGRIAVIGLAYGTQETRLLQRDAAGWGTPALGVTPNCAAAARSPDGRAFAVAGFDGTLWIERDGVVAKTRFFPFNTLSVGFGTSGKAWVLDWLSDPYPRNVSLAAPAGVVPAAVFDER